VTAPLQRSSPADADRYHLAWAVWPADRTTPTRAFLTLRASGHQACLLESVDGPARLARYSFVGLDPVSRFHGGPKESWLSTGDEQERIAAPAHEALRQVAARTRTPAPPAGLPPFCGGWIGWFAFEWASTLEPSVPRASNDPWDVPDATFNLVQDLIAFDHAAQKLFVICAAPAGEADYAQAQERIERVARTLEAEAPESGSFELLDPEPRGQTEKADYLAAVDRLRDSIRQGEIFQGVLSQRFEQRFDGDPFTLYRALRLTNASPHMFFFEADGICLVGSSPERLVAVKSGTVEVVPIAGTRARSEDPDEDERLGAELRADEKECAEHDMLVDLARNDVGRIARIGTVRVKEYAVLEKFPRVQHLVSRVEAQLASGLDAIDALAACFPAGTVSGAPKVRAMQLLAQEEGTTRGPYAGAFGYLDGAGNLDMAISIRTMVVRDNTVHVQAGAGIVFDSQPEAEYAETLQKARALFEAVELAGSPAFQAPDANGPKP
jgi:anthranilate synthase component 1